MVIPTTIMVIIIMATSTITTTGIIIVTAAVCATAICTGPMAMLIATATGICAAIITITECGF